MLQHLAVESTAASVSLSQDRLATAFQAIATTLRAPARKNPKPRLVPPARLIADASWEAGPVPLGQSFPLYHRPGAVVLLDDQPDHLERLAAALPQEWNVVTFASPHSCLNFLQQEPPRWEADFWAQRRIIDDWYENVPLIPQILAYWADQPDRGALTQVFVCDDLMPGMDGVDLLAELVDWPGYRVLLNSADDEDHLDITGRSGLIDSCLPKQAPDLVSRLTDAVNGFLEIPNARRFQIWSRTLSVDQALLLRVPSIAGDLANFARRTWIEWVAIGEPFGVLGVDGAGRISWLQLEPAGELPALAEEAARHGATPGELDDIRNGRSIGDYKLQKCLGHGKPASVLPAFYVGDGGELLAAIQRIHAPSRA
jgi:CheY-like chemotaxis protein